MIYNRPKWNWDQMDRNLFYIKQRIYSHINNVSTYVKILSSCLILGYILFFFLAKSSRIVESLVVIPGNLNTPLLWIWTLITFSFIEFTIWNVLIDLFILNAYSKLIEPIWDPFENLKFFFIINISVACISTFLYLMLFVITSNVYYLFYVQIHGMTGYLAGILIAIKQILPDNVLFTSPIITISNQTIPSTMLMLITLLWIFGFVKESYLIMFFIGLCASWIYLRFFQIHKNGTKGDMADNFSFASFFPYVFQPSVDIFSTIVYQHSVRLGLCKEIIRKIDNSIPTGITIVNTSNDTERRKQIAVKALNERLSEIVKQKQIEDQTVISN